MNPLEAHLAALAERFRQRAASDRVALAQALTDGDRKAVAEIAHKLAGLAGMVGHPEVTEVALKLEAAAEDGRPLDEPATSLDVMLAAIAAGGASSS